MTQSKTFAIITGILTAIFLSAALFSLSTYLYRRIFFDAVPATVTSNFVNTMFGENTTWTEFTFTQNGHEQTVRLDRWMARGTEVTLLINPNNPTQIIPITAAIGIWFYYLIPAALFGAAFTFSFGHYLKNRKKEHPASRRQRSWSVPTPDDLVADDPTPFGYKNAWYAIKNETPESVIEKLNLETLYESNWAFGLEHSYRYDTIFVSPQIGGYVLVIGLSDIAPDVDYSPVKKHSEHFAELQFFGSHRVSDYSAWAKFINGHLLRAYTWADGELKCDEGALTPEEIALGFDAFPSLETDFSDDSILDNLVYPDEEDVLNLAKAWGFNTLFEGANYEKSTGHICRFNHTI